VPATGPVKLSKVVLDPLQIVCVPGVKTTLGVGLTVIVKLVGVPLHTTTFVYTGVTVIVELTGALPVFKPVKLLMFPTPLPANPIDVLLFVHV
jgi:hypothetical protein